MHLDLVLECYHSFLFQICFEITLLSLLQGRIAQCVECWTEQPGKILKQVQFPGAARDFPPSQLSVQTLSQCSYSPSEQLCASTSVCIKNPKRWQPHQLPVSGHMKMLHMLTGMGRAALAAAVALWVRWPKFTWDKELLRKKRLQLTSSAGLGAGSIPGLPLVVALWVGCCGNKVLVADLRRHTLEFIVCKLAEHL